MAALSAARNTPMKDHVNFVRAYPVGNDIVYQGGLVSMLVSGGTGVLLAAQDTDNHRCIGVAKETVDGTGGDSPMCEVYTAGSFQFAASSPTTAWIGVAVCVVDDQTVGLAATTTHDIIVGLCEGVDATNGLVWVRLQPDHVTA